MCLVTQALLLYSDLLSHWDKREGEATKVMKQANALHVFPTCGAWRHAVTALWCSSHAQHLVRSICGGSHAGVPLGGRGIEERSC